MCRGVWLWLVVVVCAILLSTSEALRCYHCSNCRYELGTPKECNFGYEVCMKVTIVGRVEKSCGRQAVCGFGHTKRGVGVVTSWNRLQNLLSDVNQDLLRIPDGMEASSVMCCTSDYCNGAPSNNMMMINALPLLLLPLAVYYMSC